jgi:NAD(P)-dependent dehydrogenase (short-subunit alcohol dehydrogenase family)
MKVVLSDVERAALDRAVRELELSGAEVLGVRCDVSRAEDVEALADAAFDRFGAVHVLCNNAGVASGGPLWEARLAEWEWLIGVNLWGVIHGIRTFVPRMIAQDEEGHIVNTASLAGLTSNPFGGIYAITKHAVVAASEVLHQEFAILGKKLKVSVLCPAWVRTNIADAHRNEPEALRALERKPSDHDQQMREFVLAAVESGQPPEKIADAVFQAIQDERFYVLTHPEFSGAIARRMKNLVEQKNPDFVPLAPEEPVG